ncbi:MAG: LysM peptidoglycan-binding domain-containing protein [Cyclobacteriaceae bacterium]|nr:LysM peptidoglycan-binding domain-containing protein [Cyclobacteriaceae bacterium]
MVKLLFVLLSWSSSTSDSLRVETINGKQFIIHQIDAKETLYSISRRYGVPVTVILESNPSSEGGISVGRLLKVPYTPKIKPEVKEGKRHVVAAKETLFSISRQYEVSVEDLKKANGLAENNLSLGQELIIPSTTNKVILSAPTEMKSVSSMHTVVAKETMYSIARQYGISVQQLKEWNNLQDELPIGKMLLVVQPKYSAQASTETIQKPVSTSMAAIRISENVIGTDEVKESGMAELMEGTESNRKYLALHRSIKPGTILKVRNEASRQEVFVRITGVLPPSTNPDIVIQISKSAYSRLGATEAKFRIELTYFK